jgi:hypothetical protein
MDSMNVARLVGPAVRALREARKMGSAAVIAKNERMSSLPLSFCPPPAVLSQSECELVGYGWRAVDEAKNVGFLPEAFFNSTKKAPYALTSALVPCIRSHDAPNYIEISFNGASDPKRTSRGECGSAFVVLGCLSFSRTSVRTLTGPLRVLLTCSQISSQYG